MLTAAYVLKDYTATRALQTFSSSGNFPEAVNLFSSTGELAVYSMTAIYCQSNRLAAA